MNAKLDEILFVLTDVGEGEEEEQVEEQENPEA
jgi:hypothetical protein